MKIMAIDTSTSSMSVAVTDCGIIKYEYNQNYALTHSESLMCAIEEMMKTVQTDIHDIDLFACSVGPGSFTGVRIGVSVINAFSYVTGKNAVGVSVLDALAFPLRYTHDVILSVTDAQRGNFYRAFYQGEEKNSKSILKKLTEEQIVSWEEIKEEANKYGKVLLAGDACTLIDDVSPIVKVSGEFIYPRASSIALIAENSPSKRYVEPVYLRKSQAEIMFERKMEDAGNKD